MFKPRVIDIYSGSKVSSDSFTAAAAHDVWAVIHKATEGNGYRDRTYATRRKMATDAGLLWGAYHFNYGDNVKAQVDNFLAASEPDENTLLCLDFEDHTVNMSISSAIAFMKEVEQRTAKTCAIYSGNRLKENISRLSKDDVAYLSKRKLWICQYGPKLILPHGLTNWWLWQYTGDDVGPLPHSVPGFGPGVDLSVYNGDSKEKFETEWIS